MTQYLENWQVVFDNARQSYIIDGLESIEVVANASTAPEAGGVRYFQSS